MNLIWHPETQDEINEGVDYYFEKQLGIEVEFIDALEAAVRKLLEDPLFPREFDPPYRKIKVAARATGKSGKSAGRSSLGNAEGVALGKAGLGAERVERGR